LLADIFKGEIKLARRILANPRRDANPARLGQASVAATLALLFDCSVVPFSLFRVAELRCSFDRSIADQGTGMTRSFARIRAPSAVRYRFFVVFLPAGRPLPPAVGIGSMAVVFRGWR